MVNGEKIGFIGGGNMAEAFINGLLNAGARTENIRFFEPNHDRRQHIAETYGVQAADDNRELVEWAGAVVLAIKPQIVKEVLRPLHGIFTRDKLLISILAGVSTRTIEGLLGGEPRVVRAMPNTPALVDAAASAICRGSYVEEGDMEHAAGLFRSVGTVHEVAEDQMDAVTGLSGSGPAYVFTVIEALAAAGVQQGLRLDVAHELALQTVYGAAKLVKETGEHPALLREKVCSPGGTTIAAIRTLEERGLRASLMEAVAVATRRSEELGRE
ncbi:pyrroline-5-carboxylate reductase [Geothermobacter ehrlichii]|uniref:Pyrroline-5-carboxylate reductase n=1 Tax=Geothermobacter ehrlichii TaxID=213224 RepID=A0A5D3WLN0_9BACT|nr:pyrroline-5-carboxylate reductase [Geothermobacter ehrlichii]TYO99044.1 pyrroline-5-carboxylate reductase [Geothermobacter ehrlichii]